MIGVIEDVILLLGLLSGFYGLYKLLAYCYKRNGTNSETHHASLNNQQG